MNTLVIDIGGTNVKFWKTDEAEKTKVPSGKELTPVAVVEAAKEVTKDWPLERVSIGYPGEVRNGRPTAEPFNLADGWVDFDFAHALNCPVRMMNDACMQALGSYEGGKMLYMGFGTGVGCAFIADGVIVPLAVGHLKLWENETFDHYLSKAGFTRHGKKRWRQAVGEATGMLKSTFFADYVVLGGGNAEEIKEMPEGCRRGGNHNAFFGGLRMWDDHADANASKLKVVPQVASESA